MKFNNKHKTDRLARQIRDHVLARILEKDEVVSHRDERFLIRAIGRVGMPRVRVSEGGYRVMPAMGND